MKCWKAYEMPRHEWGQRYLLAQETAIDQWEVATGMDWTNQSHTRRFDFRYNLEHITPVALNIETIFFGIIYFVVEKEEYHFESCF